MARKKIDPEEEVSKPCAWKKEPRGQTSDDAAPADLMPGSKARRQKDHVGSNSHRGLRLRASNGNDAEGSAQTEKPESVSAEKASEEQCQ